MKAFIEQLFGMKLPSTIRVEDTTARERRMAELIALLADIADPDAGLSHHDDHGCQNQETEGSVSMA